jgi:hypothetical protein
MLAIVHEPNHYETCCQNSVMAKFAEFFFHALG